MAGHQQPQQDFNFQTVQLFKDKTLGTGSYGAVCKAKCDQLPCAAKLLYPVLFNLCDPLQAAHNVPLPDRYHRQPLVRFEQECRFLSQIRHPNIVQYLETHCDQDTNAPVLLMELMDESLTHFLETSQGPLLFHVQLNILHDTALAISYLHSNGIIHRDLSSNNVLLVAGSRAKVTDFGMSKLTDAAAPCIASLTLCPGTAAYMSPEALDEPPVYSDKLDCFSFGVLTIQVSTREFPKPTDRFQVKEVYLDRSDTSQQISARVLVPEVERRQSHISLVPQTHPLLPIALHCLKDRDVERPTAQQLCQRLEALKTTPLYTSSVQQICDKDLLLQDQRRTIRHHEQQLQTKDGQLQTLREQVQTKDQQLQTKDQQLQDKDQQLSGKDEEIQQLRQQVQSSQEIVAKFQQQITEKDSQLQQLQSRLQQLELRGEQQQHHSQVRSRPVARRNVTLKWSKGLKAPREILAGSSTTDRNNAYFRPHGGRVVYEYDSQNRQWSALPVCPHDDSTIVIINGLLTAVGGYDSSFDIKNKLLSLMNKKWVEHFSPMPTKRRDASVLCSGNEVIVAGGLDERAQNLTIVEIMNIHTNTWNTASSLPYAISGASISTCGEAVFMVGGDTDSNNYSVLTCSLRELLQSSRPTTPGTQEQQSSTPPTQSSVWNNTADLSVRRSTCATVDGCLLAIGGKDSQDKRSTAIHQYNSIDNKWEVVSHMTIARSWCMVSVLPYNKLMVVGGRTDTSGWSGTTVVETATLE